MAGYDRRLVDVVDARVARLLAERGTNRAVGTVQSVAGTSAYVLMDGDSLPMPCKYLPGVALVPDSRVVLDKYGDDWTVTGGFGVGRQVASPRDSASRSVTWGAFAHVPGAEVAVAFVAPPSGEVQVSWYSDMVNATAASENLTAVEIRTGSEVGAGSPVYAATTGIALRVAGPTNGTFHAGTWETVDGLTPGGVHHARMLHFRTAGTLTVANRRIAVRPEL